MRRVNVILITFLLFGCGYLVTSAKTTQAAKANNKAATETVDAQTVIKRAIDAVGLSRANKRILHYNLMQAVEQPYQSDRSYPPFFSALNSGEIWFDSDTGIERYSLQTIFPGVGPRPPSIVVYKIGRASCRERVCQYV